MRRGETHHLLGPDLVALRDLRLELRLADVLALGERDVEGLGADHLAVELGDGLGRLVGGGEADKAKALGDGLVVDHDLARGDLPKGLKLGLELLLRHVVVEVLNVEVHALVLEGRLVFLLLVRALELLLSLALALRARDEELLAAEVLLVEVLERLAGVLVVVVVDESESLGRAGLGVERDDGRGNGAVLVEESLELLRRDVEGDVLDVEVRVVCANLVDFGLPLATGDVDADKDDLVVEEHAVDALDGRLGRLARVVVDKAVAERVALHVDGDLAREDVTERGERVVKGLVVDVLVKVLDENVAGARLAERRVALGPHDATGAELDERVVELLEGALACTNQRSTRAKLMTDRRSR